MKILIIEDELPARGKLIQMLRALDSNVVIVGETGSVKDSVDWIRNNPSPDVAFVDIQLSDNHSFEIFRQQHVTFPIVFTTAFDQYLLESFEFNSIDYLLKPVTEEKLLRSMRKIKTFRQHFSEERLQNLVNGAASGNDLKRVVARKGTAFIALSTEDIAYFYTEHKVVFAKDHSGRKLIIDHTLSDLEERIDNTSFFRINRKYLANARAIEKFKPDNGKILITLNPPMEEEIHGSKETAPAFRQWIGKK
jgi:DNA-binding LytR/AlgR family response regulator